MFPSLTEVYELTGGQTLSLGEDVTERFTKSQVSYCAGSSNVGMTSPRIRSSCTQLTTSRRDYQARMV